MIITNKIINLQSKSPIKNSIIFYPSYDNIFLYKKKNFGFIRMKTIMNELLEPTVIF